MVWWRWFPWFCFPRRHPHERITGRFAGAYYFRRGVLIVADQTVPGATAVTAPLVFTSSTRGVIPGPIGTISADNPAASASLSADGQSVNVMTAPTGAVTVTWSDPAGVIASFSVTLTDQIVVPPEVITGAFGTFAPGTTA